MKMKWTIAALLGFGVLAAFFVSLLVSALSSDDKDKDDIVEVVVTTQSLPAISVVSSRHIRIDKVSRKGIADGYLTDPLQAIGKVLAVPVTGGQVLTRNSFVTEGSGAQLAAALPHGMRAISVPISKHSVMGGLLYPGCIVDVIATFRLRTRDTKGEAISTTLLQSVQVLAIQEASIVSKTGEGEQEGKKSITQSNSRASILTVTLMVDTRQAEALQLAMENGSISLAMRNPLDKRLVSADATILDQGRLAKLGSLLESSVISEQADTDMLNHRDSNSVAASGDANSPEYTGSASSSQFSRFWKSAMSGRRASPQWEVTVIRGKDVKEEVLELPSEQAAKENE